MAAFSDENFVCTVSETFGVRRIQTLTLSSFTGFCTPLCICLWCGASKNKAHEQSFRKRPPQAAGETSKDGLPQLAVGSTRP